MKQVVLAFRGHLERDDAFSYALGDDAPVFVHGVNDQDALERFTQGLLLYVNSLAERGDLDSVVKAGLGHLKLSAVLHADSQSRLHRDADRFDVELAGIR